MVRLVLKIKMILLGTKKSGHLDSMVIHEQYN